eukprot:Tbor_TRINITY_DN5884_c5_g6::TRINITY_DN5884_c5_g6_i1::g.7173::m.7173
MFMSLGEVGEEILQNAGLSDDSYDRVAELCIQYRQRVHKENERFVEQEENAATQEAKATFNDEENHTRCKLDSEEMQSFLRFQREYQEFKNEYLHIHEKNKRLAEMESWRDREIKKLEREKYRQANKDLLQRENLYYYQKGV